MSDETKTEETTAIEPIVKEIPVIGDVTPDLAKEIETGVASVEAESKLEAESESEEEPKEILEEKSEEAKPAEKESTEEKKVEPEKDVAIPDALLERAAQLGMKLVDAKSFQNAKALESTLALLDKKAEAEFKVDEKIPAENNEEANDVPILDPEKYDEGIIAAFDAVNKKVANLEAENKSLRSNDDRASSNAATAAFDTSIAGLGKDYEKILGVGDINTIQPKDFESRAALAQRVSMVKAGYDYAGRTVSSDQVFAEAVKLEFPDVKVGSVAEQATTTANTRNNQITNPPGRTAAKPKLGVESEIAAQIDAKFVSP